jgi:hypothetical protein
MVYKFMKHLNCFLCHNTKNDVRNFQISFSENYVFC